MISWKELKERRITQIVLGYVVAGWVVVTVFGEVVDRGVLSELVYRLVLILYLGGIPFTLILGWFHGEKGAQKVTVPEVMLLSVVLIVTAGSGWGFTQRYLDQQRVALPGDLNTAFAPTRVAVLYFDDRSGTGEFQHVADGLTEGLIDELQRVRELDVVSRNGVEPYRGESLAPDSVGRALDAGSVIHGSVELAGSELHVGIRLIDAESGVDIERGSFRVPVDELLAAPDSLSSSAATLLRRRLGEDVRVREQRAGTRSTEAWTHVLRAERLRKDAETTISHDYARGMELFTEADSLLRMAEGLDPAWIEPTVLRAHTALRRAVRARSADVAVQALHDGIALVDPVIQRDPRNARAWETRGLLQWLLWVRNVSPTPAAREELLAQVQTDLEQAEQIDPTRAALGMSILARIYQYIRQELVRGALTARRALDADPYLSNAASIYDGLFWAQYDLGQFAEAERACREARSRFPEDVRFTECELWTMIAPTADPDPAEAWRLLEQADSLDDSVLNHHRRQIIVAGALVRAELPPDSARSVLLDARVGPEVDQRQRLLSREAIVRTILGDYDEAVELLTRYVSANPGHQFEVEGELHWWWRPLRNHPGFDVVVSRGH